MGAAHEGEEERAREDALAVLGRGARQNKMRVKVDKLSREPSARGKRGGHGRLQELPRRSERVRNPRGEDPVIRKLTQGVCQCDLLRTVPL